MRSRDRNPQVRGLPGGQHGGVGAAGMPAATVDLDASVVRGLLRDQFPHLATMPVALLAEGWDNAVFRVGESFVARLPRRGEGAVLIEHEQRWLPELAPRLPLPTPAPLHVGAPGRGYPWRWSICPWLPGEPAAVTPPDDLGDAADALASFLAALHRPAPGDAPRNPVRGVPVVARQTAWEAAADSLRLPGEVSERLGAIWRAGIAARVPRNPRLWIHGDLHPANLLVEGGRLSGVIDFGDMAAGDPATDLAVAWMLLDERGRSRLRNGTSYRDDTWRRAHAWAAGFAVVMLASSADGSLIERIGERTMAEVLR